MKTKKIFIPAKKLLMGSRLIVLGVLLPSFVFINHSFGQNARGKKKLPAITQTEQRPKLKIGSADFMLPKWMMAGQPANAKAGIYNLQLDTNTFNRTTISRYRDGEIIPFTITSKDEIKADRNILRGNLFVKDRTITFILRDSLLLNYKTWKVIPNSQVIYSTRGIIANLSLTRDSASITANSQQLVAGSPIDLSIQNVHIGDLLAMLGQDSALFGGLMNGRLLVSDLSKNLPAITGSATVRNLSVMQQIMGELRVNAQKGDEDKVYTSLELVSDDNQATLTGNYSLSNSSQQLDGLLEIKKLPAALFPILPKGIFTRASGNVNGSIRLGGNFKKAEWKGELNIDSTRFLSQQSESPYTIYQQKIFVDYPSINFNQFTIKDSLENTLVINGKMILQKPDSNQLDLKISARNFTVVSAPMAMKNQVYGYAAVDGDVSVTGSTKLAKLKGEIYLNKNTALTIVLPEKNTDKSVSNSLVRFIDADTFALIREKTLQPSPAQVTGPAKLLNYELDILSDPHAALTIIMDPSTGDELAVKGKAHLNAAVDTAGRIAILGKYTLDSGYYRMNYQYLSKQFNVLPGSTITFNDEPANAGLNIRAVYIANTSPMDLLGNEVGVVDRRLLKSFYKKIRFEVILKLNGFLKEPLIGFDIQLPPKEIIGSDLKYTIENKLVQLKGDVSATNKQVFALLMLERFVGEQSADFFKGNGSAAGFAGNTTVSVSQFLSSALDEIASDLFTGINVDLNLNSYKDFMVNDGAHKTDLGVEVSKSFLDDRLSITVGRTYGIESQDGSAKAAQQKGSRFLPDVTVNYKLSKDGKYKLRSYKKDPFEVILDGYVVETGLAFIITMDLESYKALFMKEDN